MSEICLQGLTAGVAALLASGHKDDAEWVLNRLAALRVRELPDELLADLTVLLTTAVILGGSTTAFERALAEAMSRPIARKSLGRLKAAFESQFGHLPPGTRDRARWVMATLADIEMPAMGLDEANGEVSR